MNVLIVILLVVAVVLLAVIAFRGQRKYDDEVLERFRESNLNTPWPAPLNAQIERTQMMGEELKKSAGKLPINDPLPTGYSDNKLRDTKHQKAQFYIPENLSENEKQILRDFYGME